MSVVSASVQRFKTLSQLAWGKGAGPQQNMAFALSGVTL